MSQLYPDIERLHSNINSKLLFKKIDADIMDVLPATIKDWYLMRRREDFYDYVCDHMEDYKESGVLDRVSVYINVAVVTQNINNYTLVISYRQKDSLNTTTLRYSFNK